MRRPESEACEMKSLRRRTLLVSGFVIWLQMAFVPAISVKGAAPDLMLLLIAFYAFAIDYRDVVWVGFFLGLCRDFLSHSFFGLETASFVSSALLLQYAVMEFNRGDYFVTLLGVFLFLIVALSIPVLLMIAVRGTGQAAAVFPRVLFISVYTTVAAVGVFPVFRRLFGMGSEKQYELF